MSDNHRRMRPVHAGARLYVAFQIVGVQFDQASGQMITATIHGAGGGGRAVENVRDTPVAQNQPAGKGLIGKHEVGVGQDGVRHCVLQSEQSLCRQGSRPADDP
jgi:hypothetical protein